MGRCDPWATLIRLQLLLLRHIGNIWNSSLSTPLATDITIVNTLASYIITSVPLALRLTWLSDTILSLFVSQLTSASNHHLLLLPATVQLIHLRFSNNGQILEDQSRLQGSGDFQKFFGKTPNDVSRLMSWLASVVVRRRRRRSSVTKWAARITHGWLDQESPNFARKTAPS